MIRKLLRKLLKPVIGKTAATIAAREADKAVVRELDKRTGGLASKVDEAL